MHSDMIGKIDKAKRYAQEPERITIRTLELAFRGGNNHAITLKTGVWECDCQFFHRWRTCSHVMAVQRMLAPMLEHEARQAGSPFSFSEVAEAVG